MSRNEDRFTALRSEDITINCPQFIVFSLFQRILEQSGLIPNAGNTPNSGLIAQHRSTPEPLSLNDSLPGETPRFESGDAKYTQHNQNTKGKHFQI
jgi:hypothetical protein